MSIETLNNAIAHAITCFQTGIIKKHFHGQFSILYTIPVFIQRTVIFV